jgi:hypothetical protein
MKTAKGFQGHLPCWKRNSTILNQFAESISVSQRRVGEILAGKRAIKVDINRRRAFWRPLPILWLGEIQVPA